MKFVSTLSEADQADLTAVYRSGPSHRQRQRAQAVLLSAQGYTLDQLSQIVQTDFRRSCKQTFADRANRLSQIVQTDAATISRWLDQWKEHGLPGLSDAPKSGRPRKIDAVVEAHLRDVLQNPTPNLKAALEDALEKKGSK
ncbi:hypothetical protein CCAX7_14250 [Capsulimonas corticalis]|uniref:Uncharacterized protein n=1 Tax=Capsulimonas corticalis TaxID=2219043 RepID=A0A402D745_9BACT|nr:helix-turn-helix domain-containing protein [Capsulimonas corticalis]BDI29374.1 hypothetical protein CCAX7_14250 [Capsulimonas corticalis]